MNNMASFTFVLLAVSLFAASSAAPQNSARFNSGITIPEGCKGKDFCTIRPGGYDEIEAKINSLLQLNMTDVENRSGGGDAPVSQPSEDDDNCPSVTSWESIYAYNSPSATELDIIVQTKVFSQQIAIVTCKHSERENRSIMEGEQQCFRRLGLNNFNLKSSCRESTATRRLLVYDPQTHRLKMKGFTIPVCCSCHISKAIE